MKDTAHTPDPMISALKFGALVAVICFGLWGCSKPVPTTPPERVRALESRCVQLEQDYRTVAQARDRARKELADAQEQLATLGEQVRDLAELRTQLAARTRERDEARGEIMMRMSEREALLTRCDKLRKGIQSLLSLDEPTGSE